MTSATKRGSTVLEEFSYDPWGRSRNPHNWNDYDVAEPTLFTRGFTGHEHIGAYGLINMNGRVYDPRLGRFLSPDPYVQAPDFSQSFNRYSYVWNNPLKYIDPDGELIWIPFAIYGAWVMGVKAGIAAERSGGHFWRDGFWKGALVGFATGAIGGSGIAPFGTQWLGTTLWGSFVGTASHAGNIWAMGGKDYSKIWQGALIGGTMGFMASEQFNNMVKGKGFASNDRVLDNFRAGKYGVTEGSTWQQDALDYFGFKGTYEPNAPIFQKHGPSPAAVDPSTGQIFFHDFPFEDNFHRLAFIADHEMFHSRSVLSGKYKGIRIDLEIAGLEEWNAYMHNFRNQGLYRNHGFPLVSRIKRYGTQAGIYGPVITPTGYSEITFNERWWHFIYRIPRIW